VAAGAVAAVEADHAAGKRRQVAALPKALTTFL
jgi:hypothetical protein